MEAIKNISELIILKQFTLRKNYSQIKNNPMYRFHHLVLELFLKKAIYAETRKNIQYNSSSKIFYLKINENDLECIRNYALSHKKK